MTQGQVSSGRGEEEGSAEGGEGWARPGMLRVPGGRRGDPRPPGEPLPPLHSSAGGGSALGGDGAGLLGAEGGCKGAAGGQGVGLRVSGAGFPLPLPLGAGGEEERGERGWAAPGRGAADQDHGQGPAPGSLILNPSS